MTKPSTDVCAGALTARDLQQVATVPASAMAVDVSEFESELRLLHAIAAAMGDAESLSDALGSVVEKICKASGLRYGEAWTLELGSTWQLGPAWHGGGEALRALHGSAVALTTPPTVVIQACESGAPTWSHDLKSDAPTRAAVALAAGFHSVVAVPIMAEQQAIGALTFYVAESSRKKRAVGVATLATAQLGLWLKRKQAEDSMRASEARLRLLLDHVGDAVIFLSAGGLVQTWTPAAQRTFGYRPEDILAQHLQVFYPREKSGDAEVDLARAGREGRSEVDDWRVRKDGSRLWVHSVTCPVRDGRDAVVGYAQIVRDLTEAHRAEVVKAKYALALERSNRELEGFAAIASHDMQEPLRKILAFGDRLRARCGPSLDEKGRHYLDRIGDASHRMQLLVDDLLAYSKVGGRTASHQPVDLNLVVRDVLGDLDGVIDTSHASISSGALPTIHADATQMRRLFQNLLVNAMKFQAAGNRPAITIVAKPYEGRALPSVVPVLMLQLEFCDNGIGIEAKYLDRIFGMLQRLHGRTEYEGTGMGLAICRKIVERHGGTIFAESSPGKGTTFIVRLPIENTGMLS